jgi:hypothetical protein
MRPRLISRGNDTRSCSVRIPMMSISRSEVMAISAERSDARLFQCETVIDIRQVFCWFSVLFICLFFRR